MTPPLPTLSPAAGILLLSVVCGFVLKITVAYGLCLLVTRFATSASLRFLAWLSFLGATALFWIACLGKIARSLLAHTSVATASPGSHPGLPVTLSLPAAQFAGRLLGVAALSYLVALLLLTFAGIWKRIQLARALRYRIPPSPPLSHIFHRVSTEVQAPLCELWLLPGLASPASLGWARPAVYLPAEENFANAALDDVLLHELSHVRRRDGLWDDAARLCRWLVFFHPLVYKAYSSMRLERELACDLLVVQRNPAERDRYADTLVRFGWKTTVAHLPDHIGIGFTSQAAVLKARVRSILERKQVHSRSSLAGRVLLSAAACWSFAAIAPLLWIAFGIPAFGTPAAPSANVLHSVAPSLHSLGHARRPALPPPAGKAPATPATIATADLSLPAAFQPTHHGDSAHGFHVQNADEPMSNPVPDDTAAAPDPAAAPSNRGSLTRPPLPSGSSVLLNTAAELGRLGHDHDHDHD